LAFKPERIISIRNIFAHGKSVFSGADKQGIILTNEVKRNIEECKNARDLMERPVNKMEFNGRKKEYEIINLGENVNSKYHDYGPVLSPDDSLLYFTSRRKGSGEDKLDPEEGKYFEDIYVSKLEENGWGEAKSIGPPINTPKNEAVNFLSVDGKTLYFCRGTKNGTFYTSAKTEQGWSRPKPLEHAGEINSSDWKTSLSYSVLDNTLYVVSDKEGGLGGRDIYKSVKTTSGTWGPLENLGPVINTEFDEESPFVTPDGKYLYFASKGHNSIGGFDIFRSELKNDTWTVPENLGYPINTTGNDMFFMLDHENDKAYYSSSRAENDRDNDDLDIYSITLCDNVLETVLKGLVHTSDGKPRDLFVTVVEKNTQNKVARSVIDKDGKYQLTLLRDVAYIFTFEGKGIVYFSAEVTLPRQCKAYDIFQLVEISKRVDINKRQWIQKAIIKNAFFDIKKKAPLTGTSSDEYEIWSAYVNKLNAKTTKLNYKEKTVEMCLADIYNLSDLKLNFYDTLHKKIETASLNEKSVFVFNKLKYGKSGLFKLEDQDPEATYKAIVCIGLDTIQLVPVKDGFVFPKTRLNFFNLTGVLIESAVLNYTGEFVFHQLGSDQPGLFKLEKGENETTYPVSFAAGGSEKKKMQFLHGTLFPFKRLGFYSLNDSLIERSLLSMDSAFTFTTIGASEPGAFRLEDENWDSTAYTVHFISNGAGERVMQFQSGILFPKRNLSFYSNQNDILETACMTKNRTFVFNTISFNQPGLFKMREAEGDSVNSVKIRIQGITKEAARSGNGFVLIDRLSASRLDSITKVNNSKNEAEEKELIDERKLNELNKLTALENLKLGNADKFRQQILQKKREKADLDADSIPSFPIRKLYLYTPEGKLLETAKLTKGGVFVFRKLPPDVFGLFRLEGEEADTSLFYKIKLIAGKDSAITVLPFNSMQIEDGFLFSRKKLDFYNTRGDLIETAVINREGRFVFHKLKADEPGLFKFEEEEKEKDSRIYDLDFLKGNTLISAKRIQNGFVFPRKIVRSYNSDGEVIEVAFAGRDGDFVFHKLAPDKLAVFKFEDDADARLDYKILIQQANGDLKTLQREDMQKEDGFIFPKKQLSFYDEQGTLVETALLNRKGSFVFNKPAPDEKGSFRMGTSDKDSLQYAINFIFHADTVRNKQIQNGVVTSKKILYSYNSTGEIIEVAVADKEGKFTFRKLSSDQFGIFKPEPETDLKLNYEISIVKDGVVSQHMNTNEMQTQDGYLFRKKQLSYYNKQGKLIETAMLTKNGQFVFHSLPPDQFCCFKMEGDEIDPALYQIKVLKGKDTLQTLNVKEGLVFPKKTLRFYDTNGKLIESAELNSEGKFLFKRLPYDELGSFKLENGEDPGLQANYSVTIVKDGISMRTLPLKDMNFEDGVLIPRKRLNSYDKDGVLVEVAFINKEGKFIFHKLAPDEFAFFKMDDGSDVKLKADYKIDIISANTAVKEINMLTMRSEDGIIFEDKKLNFYDAQGHLAESAEITRNGIFNFYKLKPDEMGSFVMEGTETGAKLYEVAVHSDRSTKKLEYQNGVTFPKSFLNFYNSQNQLVETAQLTKDGEFKFYRLSPMDIGSFKLEGETQDISLSNLKIIASGIQMQAIRFNKDSVVRIDQLGSDDLTSVNNKYSALKTELLFEMNSAPPDNYKLQAELKHKIELLEKDYFREEITVVRSALDNRAHDLAAAREATKEAIRKTAMETELTAKKDSLKKAEIRREVFASIARNDSMMKSVLKAEMRHLPENTAEKQLPESAAGNAPFSKLLFDFDNAKVRADDRQEMDKVISYLKGNKSSKIEVAGYTDSKGSEAYNLRLSSRRVYVVVTELTKEGIARNRMLIRLHGKLHPAFPNENPDGSDNPEGRKQNRRVEIRIL